MKTVICCFALLGLIVACGNEVDSLAELDRELEKLPSLSELPTGHDVAGHIRFAGERPDPTVVRLISDSSCHMKGSGPIEADDVIIADDGSVANVFVWISDYPDRYAPPDDEVLLDQKGCEYSPRVFGIMVGQTLRIRNSDETLHNVRLEAEKNRRFNLGQPNQGQEATRAFSNEEVMMNFECDVHPWMDGWGGVLYHPFFAVSHLDGRFEIADVPEGEWTLSWWHERLGSGSRPIVIQDEPLQLELNIEE